MTKITCDIAMSLDGFVAGADQSLENPLGEGVGDRLHRWMFDDPEPNAAAIEATTAAGAFIMGRNMFGPGRGGWDEQWKGWWGEEPPYHAPVFVLTHHAREPVAMEGDTTFTFVTDGSSRAYAGARGRGHRGHLDRRWRRDGSSVPVDRSDRRASAACRVGTARSGRATARRRRRSQPRAARGDSTASRRRCG